MGKDKKRGDELRQEVRNKNRNGLRFLKRRLQDEDAEKQLKEYENRRAES